MSNPETTRPDQLSAQFWADVVGDAIATAQTADYQIIRGGNGYTWAERRRAIAEVAGRAVAREIKRMTSDPA